MTNRSEITQCDVDLQCGRRAFLQHGTLVLVAASLSSSNVLADDQAATPLRVGLITDLHYADTE